MPIFLTLWSNHPAIKGDEPLLDKRQYPNQCAINMYAALQRSSINVRTFHGQLSWQKEKPQYAIRAQELANWLASPARPLFPASMVKLAAKDVFKIISGKRGVVFFQNYWGPGNQGDHIDLWNGFRLTHLRSIAQIHLRFGPLGFGSDYAGAESVWFWELQ